MATIRDYGGNSGYGGRKMKLCKENCDSLRCSRCKTLQYVPKVALARAAGRPKCSKCGGFLEETPSQEKRSYSKPKKFSDNERPSFDEASKQNRCRFCDKRFRSATAMKLHMEEQHEFQEDF